MVDKENVHTAEGFRRAIVKLVERFVKKWRPADLSIQCPLTVTLRTWRHPDWREKTCGECGHFGGILFDKLKNGESQRDCRLRNIRTFSSYRACPDYED